MDECFVIITARSVNPAMIGAEKPAGVDGNIYAYSQGDFCNLLTGVISRICSDMNIRVLKSECFEKEGHLALIIRADASAASGRLDELRTALGLAGEKLNAVIRVQKEDLFRYMHRI